MIVDPRNPRLVSTASRTSCAPACWRSRVAHEDADDLDYLRTDPGFKLACGRLPDSGADPVLSADHVALGENAPTLREVIRLTYAMVDIYCASYVRPPAAITLDIDDTVDVVHGHQQLALFNAIMMNAASCRSMSMTPPPRVRVAVLRPGKTPLGSEVRGHLRRLVRRIRSHWPTTRLTIRGDSHYGRPEVMAWCKANDIDYIFGLSGNAVLDRQMEPAADDVRVRYAEREAPVVRRYAETRYGAKAWKCQRRVAARIEATCNGLDIRYVVTSIVRGSAEWLYDTLYCERGR